MDIPLPPYPDYLQTKHVTGAKFYANRIDMIADLNLPPGGKVAEIGVMRGDFSCQMMDKLHPRQFVAFDLFKCHELPEIWRIPSKEFFEGMTQLDYYRRRMQPYGDALVIEEGWNKDTLPKHTDGSFDLVYIDAGHEYDDVKFDADHAARMVKPDGVLVFNDYIIYDYTCSVWYGVVPVVNEMIHYQGWQVLGFALNSMMFCDIAIRRMPNAA